MVFGIDKVMYYWRREFVNERLGISKTQSYRIVPATESGRIRSDSVLSLLNRARVGVSAALTVVPADLLTPEQTAARFADSGVTERDLRRWIRRTRNPAPHFRLNRNTVRFSAGLLEAWLAETSVLHGAWHRKEVA